MYRQAGLLTASRRPKSQDGRDHQRGYDQVKQDARALETVCGTQPAHGPTTVTVVDQWTIFQAQARLLRLKLPQIVARPPLLLEQVAGTIGRHAAHRKVQAGALA